MSELTKNILKDSFWLSASNTLSRFISFFSVIIITAILNLSEYGSLVLVMTVTAPVELLSGFGIHSVIISDIAKFIGEKKIGHIKRLLKSYITMKLVLTMVVVVVSWFFRGFLVARFGDIVNDYYYLLTIWIFAVIFFNIFSIILNAHESFKIISISRLVEVTVKLVFVLTFWLTGIINLQWVLVSYILAKIFTDIYLFIYTRRILSYLNGVKETKESILRNILFKHGKWDIMSQTITQQIDTSLRPWIIKFFIGVEGVAIFSVARNIYTAIIGMVPIKQVIFPLIARNLKDKVKNILIAQKATKYTFIIYFVMAVFSFWFISPFINIFFPKYIASILLFRILLLRMLVTATSYGQPAFFYAYKQQKILFIMGFISIISLATLLPLSLTVFGLPGVYIEKIFAIGLLYMAREIYLRKKYGIVTWKFKSLFQFDNYDRYLINKVKQIFFSIFSSRAS